MTYTSETIIRIIFALFFAVVMGNGSVVAFNRMPPKWFEDYDSDDLGDGAKEPEKVLPPKLVTADREGRQRLPSTPWKYAFVGYFIVCGIYLSIRGGSIFYEIAVLCMLFVILEMAISDQLYQIVPDQFMWALVAVAVAFSSYYEKWWEQLAGAALGLGISLSILLLGHLLFKTGSIGGADIKFFSCMGLISGMKGVAVLYVLTTLIFAIYSAIRIASGRGTIKDKNALMPSALTAVTIYFLFLWDTADLYIKLIL